MTNWLGRTKILTTCKPLKTKLRTKIIESRGSTTNANSKNIYRKNSSAVPRTSTRGSNRKSQWKGAKSSTGLGFVKIQKSTRKIGGLKTNNCSKSSRRLIRILWCWRTKTNSSRTSLISSSRLIMRLGRSWRIGIVVRSKSLICTKEWPKLTSSPNLWMFQTIMLRISLKSLAPINLKLVKTIEELLLKNRLKRYNLTKWKAHLKSLLTWAITTIQTLLT